MKKKISFEKSSTLLIIIASLGSLFIIYRQTDLMSKQFQLQRLEQHKSVLPYLSLSNNHSNNNYYYGIRNNGIGPALIEEINITYKDSTYKDHDLRDFFKAVIRKEDPLFKNYRDISHSTIRKGMLIPANKSTNMIYHSDKLEDRNKIRNLRNWFNNKIDIEVVFSSIYGEKWMINNHNSSPIKIKSIID